MKLLRQLADKSMLEFNEEEIPEDIPDDFFSSAALQDRCGKIIYITIVPDTFNEQFETLSKYKPKKTVERPPLPKIITEMKPFLIHDKDIISYKGRPIEIQFQQRKIAALIMRRSNQQLYTSLQTIIDECLDEEYLRKVATKENAPENYIRRTIHELVKAFQVATDEPNKRYFINTYGTGYIFKP